jgi:hypothetical protein
MRFMIAAPLAGLALAWGHAAAAAPCTGYPLSGSQTSGHSYEPASPVTELVQIALVPAGVSENGCTSVKVEITQEDAGPIRLVGPGGTLLARLVRSSLTGQVNDRSVDINGQGRGDLARGRPVTLDFLEIQAGQFVAPGDYISALAVTSGAGQRTPVPVVVRVEPSVRLINGSESGVGNISLGDPTDGATATATFYMRTNAGVAITARSFNRGRMVHRDGSAFGSFAYSATLGGEPLDLARDSRVTLARIASVERAAQLVVGVAPTPSLYAGRYEDTLTLEITAY